MKLQRSTLALVATALLLGGVVLFTEARQANRSTAVQGEAAAPIYDFEEAAVVGLRIETPTQTVIFERDEAGVWQMTEPEAALAEEAAIAFLLSRLTTNGLVDTTVADAANQAEFGFDEPLATIEATLQDGTMHRLLLGDADVSGQAYYALVDPENIPLPEDAGEISVALVSEDVANGVDRPLEEWQAVVETPEPATDAEEPASDETDTGEADGEAAPIDGDGEDSVDTDTSETDTEPSEPESPDPADVEAAPAPEDATPEPSDPEIPPASEAESPPVAPEDTETP